MPVKKPTYKRAGTVVRRGYTPLSQEVKWYDTTANGAVPFGLATFVSSLPTVPQGTQPFQRIGRTILIKEVDLKINLNALFNFAVALTATPSVSYRVDLILDRQCNGTQAVGTDIYDTLSPGVQPTNRFFNLYNQHRFTLLKRWEGDLNPPSFGSDIAANPIVMRARDLVLKKRCNIKVDFSGPTGATTELTSADLIVAISCDANVPAAAQLQVLSYDSRIRYVDS